MVPHGAELSQGCFGFRCFGYKHITSVAKVRIHPHARLAGLFRSVPGCPRDVPECFGLPGISTTQVWRKVEFTCMLGLPGCSRLY